MRMPVFSEMVAKLPQDVAVHLSGFSEPTLNHLWSEMLRHASDMGRECHLYTTLAGMTEAQIFSVKVSKLHTARLHLPDASDFIFDPDLWLKKFHWFLKTEHAFSAMAMTDQVDAKIISAVEMEGIKVEFPEMLSRGGNLWSIPNGGGKIGCAMNRWHANVMLPDCSVYGDCMDWGLTVPLGNLATQSYPEIYEAAEQWKNADHSDDICAKCEWRSVT